MNEANQVISRVNFKFSIALTIKFEFEFEMMELIECDILNGAKVILFVVFIMSSYLLEIGQFVSSRVTPSYMFKN